MSRGPQVRSARVLRFGLSSLVALVGSVAEELEDCNIIEWSTCRRGPRSVDLWLVLSVLKACVNVDAWASPAHGSRIYVPAACPVGLKLIGERERAR